MQDEKRLPLPPFNEESAKQKVSVFLRLIHFCHLKMPQTSSGVHYLKMYVQAECF